MAGFVKFRIVRNECLRDKAKDLSPEKDGTYVVDGAGKGKRKSHAYKNVQGRSFPGNMLKAFQGSRLKAFLQKKISAGVAGYGKFREYSKGSTFFIGRAHLVNNFFSIEITVADFKSRTGRRNLKKSVVHGLIIARSPGCFHQSGKMKNQFLSCLPSWKAFPTISPSFR